MGNGRGAGCLARVPGLWCWMMWAGRVFFGEWATGGGQWAESSMPVFPVPFLAIGNQQSAIGAKPGVRLSSPGGTSSPIPRSPFPPWLSAISSQLSAISYRQTPVPHSLPGYRQSAVGYRRKTGGSTPLTRRYFVAHSPLPIPLKTPKMELIPLPRRLYIRSVCRKHPHTGRASSGPPVKQFSTC